jgi:hypothetical protein
VHCFCGATIHDPLSQLIDFPEIAERIFLQAFRDSPFCLTFFPDLHSLANEQDAQVEGFLPFASSWHRNLSRKTFSILENTVPDALKNSHFEGKGLCFLVRN